MFGYKCLEDRKILRSAVWISCFSCFRTRIAIFFFVCCFQCFQCFQIFMHKIYPRTNPVIIFSDSQHTLRGSSLRIRRSRLVMVKVAEKTVVLPSVSNCLKDSVSNCSPPFPEMGRNLERNSAKHNLPAVQCCEIVKLSLTHTHSTKACAVIHKSHSLQLLFFSK